MEIIHADNLTFKYKTTDENNFERSHTALDEIEIHTRRGEFIAILGRNGSGKSTLAKHMNALLVPSSGICW